MNVVLGLLDVASICIGLGEGVCLCVSGVRLHRLDTRGWEWEALESRRAAMCGTVYRSQRLKAPSLRFLGACDSPKVLRFSMDINSCLAGEPGKWWVGVVEDANDVSLRIVMQGSAGWSRERGCFFVSEYLSTVER